jgi:hypothetical protein
MGNNVFCNDVGARHGHNGKFDLFSFKLFKLGKTKEKITFDIRWRL